MGNPKTVHLKDVPSVHEDLAVIHRLNAISMPSTCPSRSAKIACFTEILIRLNAHQRHKLAEQR